VTGLRTYEVIILLHEKFPIKNDGPVLSNLLLCQCRRKESFWTWTWVSGLENSEVQ
jgi:hypothetical protein